MNEWINIVICICAVPILIFAIYNMYICIKCMIQEIRKAKLYREQNGTDKKKQKKAHGD